MFISALDNWRAPFHKHHCHHSMCLFMLDSYIISHCHHNQPIMTTRYFWIYLFIIDYGYGFVDYHVTSTAINWTNGNITPVWLWWRKNAIFNVCSLRIWKFILKCHQFYFDEEEMLYSMFATIESGYLSWNYINKSLTFLSRILSFSSRNQ